MKCIIVADGPSAAGFTPPDDIPIIAVKGAITWLSRADYWFSLDPNDRTYKLINNPIPGVKYVCGVLPNVKLPSHVDRLTLIARRAIKPPAKDTPEWWIWRWSAVLGLNKTPGHINTGNSAYGALGLAYHLGFTDVLLVGVDGTDTPRHSDGKKPNNLSHLPMLFESAMDQIKLSSISKLGNKIQQLSVEEWIKQ